MWSLGIIVLGEKLKVSTPLDGGWGDPPFFPLHPKSYFLWLLTLVKFKNCSINPSRRKEKRKKNNHKNSGNFVPQSRKRVAHALHSNQNVGQTQAIWGCSEAEHLTKNFQLTEAIPINPVKLVLSGWEGANSFSFSHTNPTGIYILQRSRGIIYVPSAKNWGRIFILGYFFWKYW